MNSTCSHLNSVKSSFLVFLFFISSSGLFSDFHWDVLAKGHSVSPRVFVYNTINDKNTSCDTSCMIGNLFLLQLSRSVGTEMIRGDICMCTQHKPNFFPLLHLKSPQCIWADSSLCQPSTVFVRGHKFAKTDDGQRKAWQFFLILLNLYNIFPDK